MEIIWISGSPFAWRVLLTLECKRIAYESRLLEASEGDLRTPEFLALNPRGKVPVLRDGATVLAESLAIMAYLDRRVPEPPLFGRDAAETGRIWMAALDFESIAVPLLDRIVRPIYFGKTAEQADDIRAATEPARAELAHLEARLADADWLVGAGLSAVDIALYPPLEGLLRAAGKETAEPFDLGILPFAEHYPRLAAWRTRIEALPGYNRTYPPHWR